MTSTTHRRLIASVAATLLAPLPWAAHAATGELWEITASADMMGMQMPMGTTKVCRKPDASLATSTNSDCKVTDYKVSGNKTTFKMVCTGADAMEGSGEGIRNGNTYSSTIKMKLKGEGEMTMKQTGKKLGGCDNPTS
jgi:hypothetical protein